MTVVSNKGIILKTNPKGIPKVDDFELVHRTIDIETLNLEENEIVLKNLYLSLDPYVRIMLLNNPELVGQIINGLGLSEVVKSNNPKYKVGDLVYATSGSIGWEEYSHIKSNSVSSFKHVNKELIKDIPLSHHVSLFNVGGLSTYPPLMTIGNPKAGETIFISTAAGSVGQIVAQIAKIKGLKVVGSTGSDEKVDFLLNELKFDAAFNYKKVDFDKALSQHCPNGIDIYFDNVGGETLDIVFNHCNRFARIVICGSTSQYNITNPEEKYRLKNVEHILFKSIRVEGFLSQQYLGTDIEKEFEKEMVEWIKTGKIIYKTDISVGIESVPKSYIDMLNGKNIGKALVKLSDH
jgi:NADPH-dependent curcumin reductase CurA